ncbi:MAG: hypothetical protein WC846_03835 [Candidatus Gracilibacteria bacterium]|jgi:hypothetical protein
MAQEDGQTANLTPGGALPPASAVQVAQTDAKNKAPVMPAAPQEESKNVFSELFGSDKSQKSSVMDSVEKKQEAKSAGSANAGMASASSGKAWEKPKLESPVLLKKFPTRSSISFGGAVLKGAFLMFVLTGIFFLSQNSLKFSFFGANPAAKVQMLTGQKAELMANVNVERYLTSALLLQKYSGIADAYLFSVQAASSEYTSQNKKEEFANEAEAKKPEILSILSVVQAYTGVPMTNEETALSIAILDKSMSELNTTAGVNADKTALSELEVLQTAKILLQSEDFKGVIAGLDLTAITDAQIEGIYDSFNQINQSSIALVNTIESKRMPWSRVLKELTGVIKEIDPLFNTEFPPSIILNNIQLASDGEITISGETSTSDTKNFTLVSNLIDTLEDSGMFMNVEDRTYNKSGEEEVFTGDFRISIQIQSNK